MILGSSQFKSYFTRLGFFMSSWEIFKKDYWELNSSFQLESQTKVHFLKKRNLIYVLFNQHQKIGRFQISNCYIKYKW